MDYKTIAASVKRDSFNMATLSKDVRNNALLQITDALKQNKDLILAANQKDRERAENDCLPEPIVQRLKFDESKLEGCIFGIHDLIKLSDPLFHQLMKRQLDDGLTLIKITCPIGVIGVIFESRPDALVQIASLCIKSGNCSILKGGSEASATNQILFDVIYKAGILAGLPDGFMTLVSNRAGIDEILKCDESVDLLIPRGSNEFVQYIMANSKIPVMGHADGVCHIYVDENAAADEVIPVIIDSKTQYPAACNTVETLLIHKDIAETLLPKMFEATKNMIQYRGDKNTCKIIDCQPASSKDFEIEYLDCILSVKIVESIDEAISHINRFGSHHTDCILTRDLEAAEKFMANVDSAGVYHNCSTRFADGFRYGFGAEVGISTGKLHARGPVGLDGLVTYKYKLFGNGQIVSDYADGSSSFHFKDLR